MADPEPLDAGPEAAGGTAAGNSFPIAAIVGPRPAVWRHWRGSSPRCRCSRLPAGWWSPQTMFLSLRPIATSAFCTAGRICLNRQSAGGGGRPIDPFSRSLALDRRGSAVALVFSGTGSEGAQGGRDIMATGGAVLIREPETAKFDGMPRSASAAGVADLILPVAKMAEPLLARGRGLALAAEIDETAHTSGLTSWQSGKYSITFLAMR